MKVNRYTPAEEQFLRDNYRDYGNQELAALMPGRSYHSVNRTLIRLGLKRTETQLHDIMERANAHTRFKTGYRFPAEVIERRAKSLKKRWAVCHSMKDLGFRKSWYKNY